MLVASTLRWLMAGDVSIRWQVLRDLLKAERNTWQREQAKVGRQGWGRALLARQDGKGNWTPRMYGRKWISTFYSLVQLRQLGLPPGHPVPWMACRNILDQGICSDGGIDPSVTKGFSDACVTGMFLDCLSGFHCEDTRLGSLLSYLLREQMRDGGWNCEKPGGAVHSSFHSTLSVLEGLQSYQEWMGSRADLSAAEARGREFLLRHRLYLSHRTGEIVDRRMLRFPFPPRWRYDVLRALDYFRAAGAAPDARMASAVSVVTAGRDARERLKTPAPVPGRQWFVMERTGMPSRWNTLRAARVLAWWRAGSVLSRRLEAPAIMS